MAIDSENDLSNILLDDHFSMDSSISNRNPLYEVNKNVNRSTSKRPKPTLKCVVCNDKAFGYNFDAVSCESCKAFFRRNALRPPGKLKCRSNGHCEINVEKRKRCKKCRLEKCFKMGMRKEWILSDEEKGRKRSKIEENRRSKQSHVPDRRRRQNSTRRSKTNDNTSTDVCQPIIIDEVSEMAESDWSKIRHLQWAYNQSITLNKVIGVPPYPACQHLESPLDFIRIPTYLASIRLITFVKNIPEFGLLDPEDRVTLVKYNLLAVVVMHIVLLYDPVSDTYHEHDTEDPVFEGKDWIKILGHKFYRDFTNLATKLIEIFQCDRVIVKIFLLIILSTKGFCAYDIDHEPTLNNHSIVSQAHYSYVESLYKYCLHHYGYMKTVILFSRSINPLLDIQHLAVQLKDCVHQQIDGTQLSPLMQSVLQLNDSNSSV